MNKRVQQFAYQNLEFRRCLSADLGLTPSLDLAIEESTAWISEPWAVDSESHDSISVDVPNWDPANLDSIFPVAPGEMPSEDLPSDWEYDSLGPPETWAIDEGAFQDGQFPIADPPLEDPFIEDPFAESIESDYWAPTRVGEEPWVMPGEFGWVDPGEFDPSLDPSLDPEFLMEIDTFNDLWWEFSEVTEFDTQLYEPIKEEVLSPDVPVEPDPNVIDSGPDIPQFEDQQSGPIDESPPLDDFLATDAGGPIIPTDPPVPVPPIDYWYFVDQSVVLLTQNLGQDARPDSVSEADQDTRKMSAPSDTLELVHSIESSEQGAAEAKAIRPGNTVGRLADDLLVESDADLNEGLLEEINQNAMWSSAWFAESDRSSNSRIDSNQKGSQAFESSDLRLVGLAVKSAIAPVSIDVLTSEAAEKWWVDSAAVELSSFARLLVLVVDGTEGMLENMSKKEWYVSGASLGAFAGAAYWFVQEKRNRKTEKKGVDQAQIVDEDHPKRKVYSID